MEPTSSATLQKVSEYHPLSNVPTKTTVSYLSPKQQCVVISTSKLLHKVDKPASGTCCVEHSHGQHSRPGAAVCGHAMVVQCSPQQYSGAWCRRTPQPLQSPNSHSCSRGGACMHHHVWSPLSAMLAAAVLRGLVPPRHPCRRTQKPLQSAKQAHLQPCGGACITISGSAMLAVLRGLVLMPTTAAGPFEPRALDTKISIQHAAFLV